MSRCKNADDNAHIYSELSAKNNFLHKYFHAYYTVATFLFYWICSSVHTEHDIFDFASGVSLARYLIREVSSNGLKCTL